jgi:pimeloyl-ACP methyl ester carboxylesterase
MTQSHVPVEGVFLEGTFYCLDDVIAHHVGRFLPSCLVHWIMRGFHWLVPQLFQDYRTCDRLNDLTVPVTLIHSRDDRVIPITHLDQLAQHHPTWPRFRIYGTHAEPIYTLECLEYLSQL